jgi:hypothetical protein
MTILHQVTHRFVERVPSPLEDGVIYVSIGFGTVIHKCCCGCGDKVVTPLSPVDWAVTYDGQSISLYPSIGRWDAPCQSHYWIKHDRVLWADKWSKGEADALKQHEIGLRDQYFGSSQDYPPQESGEANVAQDPAQRNWVGWIGSMCKPWWRRS